MTVRITKEAYDALVVLRRQSVEKTGKYSDAQIVSGLILTAARKAAK